MTTTSRNSLLRTYEGPEATILLAGADPKKDHITWCIRCKNPVPIELASRMYVRHQITKETAVAFMCQSCKEKVTTNQPPPSKEDIEAAQAALAAAPLPEGCSRCYLCRKTLPDEQLFVITSSNGKFDVCPPCKKRVMEDHEKTKNGNA